jgi:iron complex outermembrane recepter protein
MSIFTSTPARLAGQKQSLLASLGCLSAMALMVVPPAYGQETPASDQNVGLAEIIVTAQRRSENLQEVPAAITAFAAEDLARFGFSDPGDLTAQTPGLQIKSSNGQTKPNVFLRGIGTNDFNVSASGAVGFYTDEVYQGLQSAQLFQMFDLERVEVLRGPQGTLYGRNTSGGAVNFSTRKPDGTVGGSVSATYGRFDQLDLEAAAQVPLSGDVLSVRVAGVYRSTNGEGKNLLTDERVGGSESWALRSILRFAPEGQEWLLNIHGGRLDGDGPRYHFQRVPNFRFPDPLMPIIGFTNPYSPPGGDWDGAWDRPQDEVVKNYGAALNGRIDIGALTLHSVTGYENVDAYVAFDSDASPLNFVNVDFGDKGWQFSQELRLTSPSGERLGWIVGAYYYQDRVRANNRFDVGRFARELFGAPADLSDPSAPIDIGQTYAQRTRSIAAFGSVSYDVIDPLRLTLGARYTRDRKTLDYRTTADSAIAIGIPFLIDVDRRRAWSALTGNVVADYRVSDDLLVYASYNRGFKSGQFNASPFFSAADVNSADPEKVDAFEMGVKSQLMENRLRLNISAFHNRFKDLQVFQFVPDPTTGIPTSRYSNAGKAQVTGVEFEIDAKPVPELSLRLAGAYLDAEYKTFIANIDDPATPADESVDFAGNRLTAAPKLNLSGSAEYALAIGDDWQLVPSYDFTYNSRQYFTAENDPSLSQKRYWVHNASLSLRGLNDRFSASVWIRNLSGTLYNNEIFPLPDFGVNGEIRGARKSYGITLSYKFD